MSKTNEATISEIASEYGVTLRTLRFYEDARLLAPRRDGSSRWYGAADRKRLETVLAAKRLGFTISEIREILELGGLERLPVARRAAQLAHLKQQRREIDAAIWTLAEL